MLKGVEERGDDSPLRCSLSACSKANRSGAVSHLEIIGLRLYKYSVTVTNISQIN